MRATERVTGVSFNSIRDLLIRAGEIALDYHSKHIKNIVCNYLQLDEIWSFIYAKRDNLPKIKNQKTKAGDIWTWTAIDEETKLIISYLVGGRDQYYANTFVGDIFSRLKTTPQITTDGHAPYIEAIHTYFGFQVDYAQEIGPDNKKVVSGFPDPFHIMTNHVERQNLTMRMCMRRFTRSTNGFSKKLQNHIYMVALYFLYYNFCRIHSSLKITPAMASGLENSLKDISWIADLVGASVQAPQHRGPYARKAS